MPEDAKTMPELPASTENGPKVPPTAEMAVFGECTGVDLSSAGGEDLTAIIQTTLKRAFPVEVTQGGRKDPNGIYNGVIHASICRFGFLGLANATIARIVGIAPTTLQNWLGNYPKLASDLHQARGLAVTDAVIRLRQMMAGDGPTALKAVTFFLERRAPEFADRKHVEVTAGDPKSLVEEIRRDMYGLTTGQDNDTPDGAPSDGSSGLSNDDFPTLRL